MREFQERRRIKKLLHSRYAIAVLVLVCLVVAHSLWSVYTKYQKSRDLVSRMQSDAAALDTRAASLQQSIDDLNTPEGKEREVLDRFGAVKSGERMIVLVDGGTTSGDQLPPVQETFWQRILGIFGL